MRIYKATSCVKGRTIRKVMGGGVVHFQPVRSFFQNFLLVSIIIFFTDPLLEFYFFSKTFFRT